MIFRHADNQDAAALTTFHVGDVTSPWLAEVAEIVVGLLAWRDDDPAPEEGREVIVADDDGEVVAVAAHTAVVTDEGRTWQLNRYLIVVAVRADRQRSGIAQALVESLLVDLADRGVRTVEWLVHPANGPSIGFSRSLFPEADETSPPEDKPYLRFVVRL